MIEDTIYRTSSQFRFWSFTDDSLRSIRTKTNNYASDRVRAAIQRSRLSTAPTAATTTAAATTATAGTAGTGKGTGAGASGASTPASTSTPDNGNTGDRDGDLGNAGAGDSAVQQQDPDVQCLTPEEEQELVRYYCEKTLELGDVYKPPLPTIVRATAVQYLRRFYLTNSPMTYHPKTIMSCALFLATKTENYYMSLRQFTDKIPGDATPEEVIAPEFLLMQSLRFTFDVRHPFRGLDGGVMELNAIAQGLGQPAPCSSYRNAEGLRQGLLSVHSQQGSSSSSTSVSDRITRAYQKSRGILKSAAQITDVYFLYTPAQIWWSAFFLADPPLAQFYLDTKLPPNNNDNDNNDNKNTLSILRTKLSQTLSTCQSVLQSYKPLSTDPGQMKNLKRIAKKLYHCQNPDKSTPAAATAANSSAAGKKRDGSSRIPAAAAAAAAAGGGGGSSITGTPASSGSARIPQEATTQLPGADALETGLDNEVDAERVTKRRKVEGSGDGGNTMG